MTEEWYQDFKRKALERVAGDLSEKRYESSPDATAYEKLLAAGLLGTAIVSILQFLSLENLSVPLTLSVFAFAVSIPLLAGRYIAATLSLKPEYRYNVQTRWTTVAWCVGLGANVLGIACLFWHFHLSAGLIFLLVSVLAIKVLVHYYNVIGRVNVDTWLGYAETQDKVDGDISIREDRPKRPPQV